MPQPATVARDPEGLMTRGLALLFAIAGGAAVGNLYYAQPLLGLLASDLSVSAGTVALLVTITQVGYAAGLLLIVPLGDLVDRRTLIPVMMLVSSLALAVAAAAPGFAALAAASALVGVATVSGQLLTPLTSDLADDALRGRAVGVVASGLLIGILVSRTFSGLVAHAFGWRVVYAVAAVVTLVLAAVMRRRIPSLAPSRRTSYRALLASLLPIVTEHRAVRVSMLLGGIGFGLFTMFWTALTLLLSGPIYGYSPVVIGLFGLVGLVGAVAAQLAGRLHDRGWSSRATGLAWVLALGVWVLAALGYHHLSLVLVAVVLLDVAIQGQNLLNQSRVFAVLPEARSRVNTVYMVGTFVGGAAGSGLTSVLWHLGGWPAVGWAGAGVSLLALGVWVRHRSDALADPVG